MKIGMVIFLSIIFLVSCSQGEQNHNVRVLVSDKGVYIKNFRYSPDGKHIAYLKNDDLWLTDIATLKKEQITKDHKTNGFAWLDDTSFLCYMGFNTQSLAGSLVQLKLQGAEKTLMNNVDLINTIIVENHTVYLLDDKDGVTIFEKQEDDLQQIDRIDFKSARALDLFDNGNLISYLDTEVRNAYDWATLHLYSMKTREASVVEHLKDYKIYAYDISEDGRWIAFGGQIDDMNRPNIYLSRLDSSDEPRILMPDTNAAQIDWSPDGEQLILQKLSQPGETEVVILDINDNQE